MCLFLSNNDRRLQVNVDDDKQLVVTGLEEKVFDVTEENVYKEHLEPARTIWNQSELTDFLCTQW